MRFMLSFITMPLIALAIAPAGAETQRWMNSHHLRVAAERSGGQHLQGRR
jgi:hypothetical protein